LIGLFPDFHKFHKALFMNLTGMYRFASRITGDWIPLVLVFFIPLTALSQETGCHLIGRIKLSNNEPLIGATVRLYLEKTGFSVSTSTGSDGVFYFPNLKPDDTYAIYVSHTGYLPQQLNNISIRLGENQVPGFTLPMASTALEEVIVRKVNTPEFKLNAGAEINGRVLTHMPSPGRNLNDYIRYLPQSRITADGGFSLAGQFYKYNAFYIDGANNSDIHGVAPNGITGGRTGTSPVSLDALEEINVLLDPYDVQYSNFTGGSMNAVTKSGTNQFEASAWYYFRNEELSGRSPVPVEKPGVPGELERTRLDPFSSRLGGFRAGGPLARDKVFFFLLAEFQDDNRPQPFNMADYDGKNNTDSLNKLAAFLQSAYGYDPGGYLVNTETLEAIRLMAKLDWNLDKKNRLSLAYRYFNAEKTFVRGSNSSRLFFSNCGFSLPSRNNSLAAEWKRSENRLSNRLLVTYTGKTDDQNPMGQPFPLAIIRDGSSRIQFGSNGISYPNYLDTRSLTLINITTVLTGKHFLTFGTDNEWNKVHDVIIPNYFGSYQFNSLNDFINNYRPVTYQRSFPMDGSEVTDQTAPGATFSSFRFALFVNDKFSVNENLTLQAGIRADYSVMADHPETDKFFNDTGRIKISQYYDLAGAESGKLFRPYVQWSPRLGFNYVTENRKWQFRGGLGIFMGRIPLVWIATMFQNNGTTIGSINLRPPAAGFAFEPDPFNQASPESLQLDLRNARGQLEIVTAKYRLPTVFRTSLGTDRVFRNGWRLSVEGILTENIHENTYTNVNILPPKFISASPGSRNVYAGISEPERITMTSNGLNPYPGQIYLLGNNKGKSGYAYTITAEVDKNWNGRLAVRAAYTYGKSNVHFEGTSGSNSDQWTQYESVNGRNAASRSLSDFDPGHRVMAMISRKFSYLKKKLSTTLTFFYNGQSESPYSWVYLNSMVNDIGFFSNSDLMYIPGKAELKTMNFLDNAMYTAEQQKSMLETYIAGDPYLSRHRGEFAARNASRLPFTHILDFRIEQQFIIPTKTGKISCSLTWDVSNFTNLLNKDWGRRWLLPDDNVKLIRFVGYKPGSQPSPVYEYTPVNGKPYTIQTSTNPWNSARWMSQLGLRISLSDWKT
jgi:hypothetical protein